MSELSYDFNFGSKLINEPDDTTPEKIDALEVSMQPLFLYRRRDEFE